MKYGIRFEGGRALNRIGSWFAAMFLGLLIFGVVRGTYRGMMLTPKIQESFGFKASGVYLSSAAHSLAEFPQLTSVERDGVFGKAGLNVDDIILNYDFDTFFSKLNAVDSKGIEITLIVGTGNRPTDVSQLATRTVVLKGN